MRFVENLEEYRFENLYGKLKLISTKARLKLISALLKKDCYVCELSRMTGIDQPYTSKQLKYLTNAGLVKKYEGENQSFYSLDQNQLANLLCDLSQAFITQDRNFNEQSISAKRTA